MRLRLLLGTLLVGSLMLVMAGCSAMTPGKVDAVSPVTDSRRVGNAFLLRGFIGVFSTGIDHLGEEVNAAGVHGQVFQDDQWSELADTIAARYRGHQQAEPIVLIGHSFGADDAINIARKLDRADVPVNLLITLDPVVPSAVPKNVRLCVNLYQSNGIWDNLPWLRGVPLKQEPGSQGKLFNANIRVDRPDLLDPDVNHFNIEKKQKIHDEVIRLLLATCPTREEWTQTLRPKPLPQPTVAVLREIPPASTSGGVVASAARETAN